MGCGASTTDPRQPQQRRMAQHIDQQLRADRQQDRSVIKLLLLGTGECGKSTILKQLQILHCNGFSEAERSRKRPLIYSSLVSWMRVLVRAKRHIFPLPTEPGFEDAARRLEFTSDRLCTALPADTVDCLRRLWAVQAVKHCYDRRNEFQLTDSANFLDDLDRIAAADYVPTERDILMLRVPTTGVHEVSMRVKQAQLRVFDVGGQRSERRKWLHCFDNVHAIIYIVAVSEFDQNIQEDGKTNRLREALQLFGAVVNQQYFVRTSMIVFLNKRDLLQAKLDQGRQFGRQFPEFHGENTYANCMRFVEQQLVGCNERPDTKAIYVHQTCATDTDQVELIINSTLSSLIDKCLGAL